MVRPKVVEVPIGSLLIVKALTVTANAPTLLDGAARHTPEGTDFSRRAAADVLGAVRARDQPFGDYGQERR